VTFVLDNSVALASLDGDLRRAAYTLGLSLLGNGG
jgi:hypothetical protein